MEAGGTEGEERRKGKEKISKNDILKIIGGCIF